MGGILRILYATFVTFNFVLLGLDYAFLFSPTTGVLPLDKARKTMDPDTWTLFSFVPQTDVAYWAVYAIVLCQAILLGLGVFPRFQAFCVFLWNCSFHHHNNLLWNGEDTVFRLLGFFLMFLPLHRFTIVEYYNKTADATTTNSWPMWPFRLMQIQMCIIYISTVILKFSGADWRDGTALYYVVHLPDLFGGPFVPPLLFGYLGSLKIITWSTLVLEALVPILLWFQRTRLATLVVVILFHIGIDLSMNLNFFHWLCITGWLSFLVQPSDYDNDEAARLHELQRQRDWLNKEIERLTYSSGSSTEKKHAKA